MNRHVLFRVERERYAIPLAAVREVVVPGMVSRVPRSPDAVSGITNLRGRIVTVVDMKVLLALGMADKDDASPRGKLVILDRERRDLGLLVADVEGIVNIDSVAPVAGAGPAVRGVATVESASGSLVVTVLDSDALDTQVADLFGTAPARPGI